MARNNPGAGTQSLDDVWNGDSGLARGIESIFEVSFVKLVRNPNPAFCNSRLESEFSVIRKINFDFEPDLSDQFVQNNKFKSNQLILINRAELA